MKAILIIYHCESNSGYAIDSLFLTFFDMARALVKEKKDIHISFTKLNGQIRNEISNELLNFLEYDPSSKDKQQHVFIEKYIKKHHIDVVFGFDQPVSQCSYKYFRRAGVKKIISYLGAPMSILNRGLKLKLKHLEVWLMYNSPDHYIYESIAMAKTAYQGRGIPKRKTSVVYLGVDTSKFKPDASKLYYAHDVFNIHRTRKIIYYSGHMEERKGVAVLVKAARQIYEYYDRRDFHLLLLGNQEGQEQVYLKLLEDTGAKDHVTFGGYRNDLEKIAPSCFVGVIASTGWDSFTMSSLEMTASGLPLIVSNLQGLIETIEEGKTGMSFEPGNYKRLAHHIVSLLDDPNRRDVMGKNSRDRTISHFSKEYQVDKLVSVVKSVVK